MLHTSLNLSRHYLAKGAGSQSSYAQIYHVSTPRQQGNRGSGSATTSPTKGCQIDSPVVATEGKVAAPMILCLGK